MHYIGNRSMSHFQLKLSGHKKNTVEVYTCSTFSPWPNGMNAAATASHEKHCISTKLLTFIASRRKQTTDHAVDMSIMPNHLLTFLHLFVCVRLRFTATNRRRKRKDTSHCTTCNVAMEFP